MNKRVYGLLGIGAKMANWNAGFDGRPKQTLDGQIYGSDKALKYSIRNYWIKHEEKVLYYKRYGIKAKEKKDADFSLSVKTLKEVYEEVYDQPLKGADPHDILKNLFSALDVQAFGSAFATKEFNVSISGAVQIGQGFNLYQEGNVEVQDILSPFPSKEENDQSSVGKQIHLTEGHYVYPFSINPANYQPFMELLDIENPFTDETYHKFKVAALQGATFLNTCSKAGCYNEFGLFIQLKEDSLLNLEPLDDLVVLVKEEDKVTYDFSAVSMRLKEVEDQIEQVELFYNPYQLNVKGADDFKIENLFFVK